MTTACSKCLRGANCSCELSAGTLKWWIKGRGGRFHIVIFTAPCQQPVAVLRSDTGMGTHAKLEACQQSCGLRSRNLAEPKPPAPISAWDHDIAVRACPKAEVYWKISPVGPNRLFVYVWRRKVCRAIQQLSHGKSMLALLVHAAPPLFFYDFRYTRSYTLVVSHAVERNHPPEK